MTSYAQCHPVEEIEKRYTYHPPKGDQAERYAAIREKAKELAYLVYDLAPPSHERDLAFDHLDHSVMMANAAIARRE